MKNSDGGSKLERKTVEKIRRMQMKSLCFKLSSLIPKDQNYSKDTTTQQDHLDEAATYIKTLKERIERLKQRKEGGAQIAGAPAKTVLAGFLLPVIEVRRIDSSLEVVLISGLERRFMFHEVIGLLEEEGTHVVNASFSTVGDKIYHTIHSQVISSSVVLETSRISERLMELIH